MRWRPSPLVAPLVLAALALVGNLATNTVQVDAGWWPPLVWGAAVLLVVASVVLEVARGRGPGAADPARDEAAAVERLVGAVGARWRQEDEHRKVADPAPLRVSWRAAPDDVVDGWDNVCRAPMGSTALPPDLAGPGTGSPTSTWASRPGGW